MTEGYCLYYNKPMLTFLIPTAKEMKPVLPCYPHQLPQKSLPILEAMAELSLEELVRAYSISIEAASKEAKRLKAIAQGQSPAYPAYQLFNGLMYRHLKRDNLSKAQQDYLSKQVYITSSFYGIIPTDEKIAEHRHDFHTKVTINGQSLKHYWRPVYDQFAKDHKQIISLLSSEFRDVFSKEYQKLWISPKFMEERSGQLKTHSTISKKARGAFLTACLENNVQTKEALKQLSFAGFCYNEELSTETNYYYIKKES